MRNGMRSLWDFDGEGDGSEAVPPTEMGDGPSRATPLAFDNIGLEIQARLQAGDPPGKIAMYLEQLEPGLGRSLLGSINQAAGSMKRLMPSSFAQQNYGESPARAFSGSPPGNGMPVQPNFRSGLTGDAPHAIYGGAGRSVGVNPPPLKSAGVSVSNDDKPRIADGFHTNGRMGSPMLRASSPERHPGYIALAYKPGDNFWGPRRESQAYYSLSSGVLRMRIE